jgi:hypothetical protein
MGAFMIGSFFGADSIGKGPMISALPALVPFSPWAALLPLEVPASAVVFGGIVLDPFDGTAGVEGTFDPTPESSPNAEVRMTFSAGLKKAK